MKQQKVLFKSLSQKNIFDQEHKAVGTKEYHQA